MVSATRTRRAPFRELIDVLNRDWNELAWACTTVTIAELMRRQGAEREHELTWRRRAMTTQRALAK